MNRIFISDLDGTLLNSAARVSDFTRETLTRLVGAGLRFGIASARSIHSIRAVIGDLPVTLPTIEMDGAQITDHATGEHLAVHSMPTETAARVQAIGAARGEPPVVVCTDGAEDTVLIQDTSHTAVRWYVERLRENRDPRLRLVSDATVGFERRVTSLIHIGREAPMRAFARAIREALDGAVAIQLDENPHTPGWFWLRVQDAGVSKGSALSTLADLMGFSLRETVVFGDAHNDVSLFQCGAHGIAVENAVEEVRVLAAEIIGANDEDSVVRWILRAVGES